MNVLYFILPLSFLFAIGCVIVFIRATLDGQWDDLDTPPHRMLLDDSEPPQGDLNDR